MGHYQWPTWLPYFCETLPRDVMNIHLYPQTSASAATTPPPPANPLRLFCCFPLTELSAGSRWYSWSDSSSTAVPSAEMQANLQSEFRKKNTPGGLLWPAAISSFFSSIFPPSYSSVNLITAYCFLPPALHKAERLFSVILRYFLQGRSEVRLLRW